MALTGNQENRPPRMAREDVHLLVAGLLRASWLVFAGLLALALSLVVFTLATAGAGGIWSDRSAHYMLIGGIVLLYVYLQRN
jgi:hypothetical protein